MKAGVGTWIIVDQREGSGRLDAWSEYLCVSRLPDPAKFEIAICRHELVGEIPTDWFDEDGVPYPEYSDEVGDLVVPDYYDVGSYRAKLSGHDGEYLLGELALDETFGQPIVLLDGDEDGLKQALVALDWVPCDAVNLQQRINQCVWDEERERHDAGPHHASQL